MRKSSGDDQDLRSIDEKDHKDGRNGRLLAGARTKRDLGGGECLVRS